MEWLTVGSLLVVIVFLMVFIWHIQGVHEAREKDLLDRVMTKDYATFVNGEVVREAAKRPDQIYEDQQERGIPI
jgi:hypothetical protein